MIKAQPARKAAVLVVILVMIVGCSKKDETATPGTSAPAGGSTTTVPKSGPAGDCDEAAMTAVVQAKYPGAAISELGCAPPFATATVRHGTGLLGDGVALLRFRNGAWTLVASGQADADQATLLPADFSTVIFDAWRARYDKLTHPERFTTTTKKAGATPSTLSAPNTTRLICEGEGGDVKCTPETTEPPTLPPVPKTLPDGSPAPTTEPQPPTTSSFCRFNFNDLRCKADPGFEL